MQVFFCKYNDPIYVKMEKLEIMIMLASDKNIDQVLLEFKEYATEVDVDFVRKVRPLCASLLRGRWIHESLLPCICWCSCTSAVAVSAAGHVCCQAQGKHERTTSQTIELGHAFAMPIPPRYDTSLPNNT